MALVLAANENSNLINVQLFDTTVLKVHESHSHLFFLSFLFFSVSIASKKLPKSTQNRKTNNNTLSLVAHYRLKRYQKDTFTKNISILVAELDTQTTFEEAYRDKGYNLESNILIARSFVYNTNKKLASS